MVIIDNEEKQQNDPLTRLISAVDKNCVWKNCFSLFVFK